jgi:hypothetical protein
VTAVLPCTIYDCMTGRERVVRASGPKEPRHLCNPANILSTYRSTECIYLGGDLYRCCQPDVLGSASESQTYFRLNAVGRRRPYLLCEQAVWPAASTIPHNASRRGRIRDAKAGVRYHCGTRPLCSVTSSRHFHNDLLLDISSVLGLRRHLIDSERIRCAVH